MTTIPYVPPPRSVLHYPYVDDDLLIVVKPSGLLSVPGRGAEKSDCLLSRVRDDYPDALIVHRLDMETSGLLILARNPVVHRALSMQFQARQVSKLYIAVVDGLIESDQNEIAHPLITDWPNRPLQKVDRSLGKPSLTRYRVVQRQPDENLTRVELEPVTGRSHQLRVHLMSIGHPILGDALYGHPDAVTRAGRLMLHASRLSLTHPASAQTLVLASPSPF